MFIGLCMPVCFCRIAATIKPAESLDGAVVACVRFSVEVGARVYTRSGWLGSCNANRSINLNST